MEARLAELKQSQLVETQKLVRENSELIAEIQALQRDRDGVMSSATTKMNEEISQELQSRIEELKVTQNEIVVLKGKAEECDEMKVLLEKEKKMAAALRSQVEDIVSQLKKSQKDHSALELLNKSLRNSLANQEKLCSDLTRDLQGERFVQSQKLSEVHLVSKEQLAENQSRINSLEEQLQKKSRDSLQESKALKDKMRQYRELIKKLRFRLEMATIKEKDLEARQEAIRQDSVPSQRYRQLQQQLHSILNKHSEFQAFIQGLGRSQENLSQVEDLNARVASISERMSELIGHINDAYTSVESL